MTASMTLIFVMLLQVYLLLGLVFGLWFVFGPLKRLDPSASESGIGFRLLILPGVSVLWPFLLRRVLRGNDTVVGNDS